MSLVFGQFLAKKHSKSPTIGRQTATFRDQVLAKDRGVQIPS